MIHPERLALDSPEPQDEKGDGSESRIRGRVVQITAEKERIRIVVDAGIWITLLVPRDEYTAAPTPVGEQVTVLIPAEAVEVL